MSAVETAVTIRDVAQMLGKSTDTIYRLTRAGKIPGFKVGGEWRFFASKVIDHLNVKPEPWAQSDRSRRAKRVAS